MLVVIPRHHPRQPKQDPFEDRRLPNLAGQSPRFRAAAGGRAVAGCPAQHRVDAEKPQGLRAAAALLRLASAHGKSEAEQLEALRQREEPPAPATPPERRGKGTADRSLRARNGGTRIITLQMTSIERLLRRERALPTFALAHSSGSPLSAAASRALRCK